MESTARDMKNMLSSWESKLSEAENFLLGSNEMVTAIEQLQLVSPIVVPLPWNVTEFQIPWKDCPFVSSEPLSYLTRSEFENVTNQVSTLIDSTNDFISKKEYKIRLQKWIESEFPDLKSNTPKNVSLKDVPSQILAHMEGNEKRIDFASLRMGASVIKNETTLSLEDTLPFFNRIMHLFKLRFYGYGPQAALSITSPQHALGQCWSFQRDKYPIQGTYATLTIQLEKFIYIKSIAIQHPPKELTSDVQTAIQHFRILGFGENQELLNLGSFRYDVHSIWSNQEFQVHQTDIPKLRKVVLAVDSNWGGNYTCLYRIQIFGND